MKHSFCLTAILLIFFSACNEPGDNETASGKAELNGTITEPLASHIYVRQYKNNIPIETEEIASIELKGDHKFSREIDLEFPRQIILEHGDQELMVFLHPGSTLEINTSGEQFAVNPGFSGDAAAVNKHLSEGAQYFRELSTVMQQQGFHEPPERFLDIIDTTYSGYYSGLAPFKDEAQNAAYYEHQKHYIKYTLATIMLAYGNIQEQQGNHELPENYYAFLDTIPVNNPDVINNRGYISFLDNYVNYHITNQDAPPQIQSREDLHRYRFNFAEELLEGAVSDLFKTREVHNLLTRSGNKEAADELIAKMEEDGVEDRFLQSIDEAYAESERLSRGNPAPAFQYPDLDEEMVALEDLKGDVIYLDVWASWCRPCLQEFPHTAELYETFSDDDVTFLYVSIDRERENWNNAVDEYDLKGINLYAGNHFNAQIVQDYNITGIPRYIIIDREGNLFDINAPRPSGNADEAIREALQYQP